MNASVQKTNPALDTIEIKSVAIDSREVKAGDVFFALSQPDYSNNGFNGEFEDATKYVPGAFEKGAAACVVRADRYREHVADIEQFADKIILVDDVVVALQQLAKRVYEQWGGPVVAITGSAGKTTAKELTAHVLEAAGKKVLKNIKNYNNGLGHPLTVMNLAKGDSYDVAVLEMGMSTPMQEIARLCRITPPDRAVELNVLPVHVEHLGSIENVAKAKAELVEGMKQGGIAIVNADDVRTAAMAAMSKGETLSFGIESSADIMATEINFESFGGTSFRLITPNASAKVQFPLNGRHNILNALAAAAVGYSFGLNAEAIAKSLSSVDPPPQRGEVLKFRDGFTVINDSYNSNPTALLAMVKTLIDGSSGSNGRRIVVAGEMLELGPDASEIHRKTGEDIAKVGGVDLLIGVRGLAAELVQGADSVGSISARFAADSAAAGELLADEIRRGDVVLIKGSRGVKTEKVIETLLAKFELEENDTAKR